MILPVAIVKTLGSGSASCWLLVDLGLRFFDASILLLTPTLCEPQGLSCGLRRNTWVGYMMNKDRERDFLSSGNHSVS